MEENKQSKKQLGSLWERHGKNGTYYTGVINEQRVVIFQNKRPKNDKSPHMLVYESENLEKQGDSNSYSQNKRYGSNKPHTGISQKQENRLYAIASNNGWTRGQVIAECVRSTGVPPCDLEKSRYERAVEFFEKNKAKGFQPKELPPEKPLKNYAPQNDPWPQPSDEPSFDNNDDLPF